jgi:hypothetical protein
MWCLVHARIATSAGGEAANEDWVATTPLAAVVLDGITAPPELTTGCAHSVPWYVSMLGTELVAGLAADATLPDVLATAITNVARRHSTGCDLAHPGTPSATVAMVRWNDDDLEWLVLADATVLVETHAELVVNTDDRISRVAVAERELVRRAAGHAERRRRTIDLIVAQQRECNRPGGYWVAGSDPNAAGEARAGVLDSSTVRRCAVLTDGVTRLVEFGVWSWARLIDSLDRDGPAAVVDEVRKVESTDPDAVRWPRYKRSDDATAILVQF